MKKGDAFDPANFSAEEVVFQDPQHWLRVYGEDITSDGGA